MLPGALTKDYSFSLVAIVSSASFVKTQAVIDYYGMDMAISHNALFWNGDWVGDGYGAGGGSVAGLTNGKPHFLVLTASVGGPVAPVYGSVDGGPLTYLNANAYGSKVIMSSSAGFLAHSLYLANFEGTLDEVAIFPAALTQAQIDQLATAAGY